MDKLEQIARLIAKLQELATVKVTNIHVSGDEPQACIILPEYRWKDGKLVKK